MNTDKTKIIILAGGKGKRMQSELPKVLVPLAGKPMIQHLLEKTDTLPYGAPYIVVGQGKELVEKELGNKYHYVVQEEQLGTGHAVNTASTELKGKSDSIIVLYGDHPFVSAETVKKLVEKRNETNAKIVMATVKLPDFKDWRHSFYKNFSRVIRGKNNEILRSVEFKDATEEEKKISELNPCYFCFEADWLWEHLEHLKNDNAQKEYYLTDLIKMATIEGTKIESIEIDPKEALGANSKEELEVLESLVK